MSNATPIDMLWLQAHPDRQFRLRRQTPAEVAQWPVQPGPGFTAWCIVRRDTGEMQVFAIPPGEAWDDCDDELAPFFAELRSHA